MFRLFTKRIIPVKHHAIVGKTIWSVTQSLKAVWASLSDVFVDGDSWSNQENLVLSNVLWRTLRYKMAGMDFPLTENEKRFLSLRNHHAGKRVFILGNGPSLNKCDLTLLKNEITFGVNNITLNYDKMGFHPTYYVVEDVLLAEDRAQQINEYHGAEIKFFGNYLRYCIQDAPDIIWLNVRMDYRNYKNFPHFSRNVARVVWVGGTVSYICMQLAFYMGFDEVYLVGFDHTYQIPADAVVQHDTKEIISMSDDPNHFDPGYFGKGYRWHDPQVERMEAAYRRAREFFEANQRKIFNATIGGRLEVFPRVNYRELF